MRKTGTAPANWTVIHYLLGVALRPSTMPMRLCSAAPPSALSSGTPQHWCSAMPDSERKYADFGARQVPLADKQALVDDVFRSVARRYDLMNDLMSFGLHRAWKDALVTAIHAPKNRPFGLLDIAGGTGDIAMRLVERGGEQTRATVCDINADMLEVGRERETRRRLDGAIVFAEGNAEALPFADQTFDAATIAFGIRNVPRIERALTEAYRVLKIGGKFVCLGFSAV